MKKVICKYLGDAAITLASLVFAYWTESWAAGIFFFCFMIAQRLIVREGVQLYFEMRDQLYLDDIGRIARMDDILRAANFMAKEQGAPTKSGEVH